MGQWRTVGLPFSRCRIRHSHRVRTLHTPAAGMTDELDVAKSPSCLSGPRDIETDTWHEVQGTKCPFALGVALGGGQELRNDVSGAVAVEQLDEGVQRSAVTREPGKPALAHVGNHLNVSPQVAVRVPP